MAVQPVSLEQALQDAVTARARREARRAEAERKAREAEAERERTRGRTGGEVLQDVGAQLLQGSVALGQSAYGAGNIASGGTLDRAVGLSDNFRETQQIINSWKSRPTQYRQAAAKEAFEEEGVLAGATEYITEPALLQDVVVSNIPSLLPSLGAARFAGQTVARAATAPGSRMTQDQVARLVAERGTTAAARAGGIQAGGATNIEAINRAREAGATEDEAQLAGLGAGVIAGVATPAISRLTGAARLEAQVANLLGNPAAARGAVAGVARGAGVGFAREATEEGLQSSVEQGATNLFAPGVDILEDVPESAVVGAIGGGPIGAGMGGAVGFSNARARRAGDTRQQLQQAQQDAEASSGTAMTPSIRRPNVSLQDLIAERTGVGRTAGIAEVDLLDAGSVSDAQVQQVADSLYGAGADEQGNPMYQRYNPDLQSMEPISAEQAFALASEQIPTLQPEAPARPAVTAADLDTRLGVGRSAGVEPMTADEVRVQQAEAEAERLFRTGEDEEGNPTYGVYNLDTQSMEPISREEAVQMALSPLPTPDVQIDDQGGDFGGLPLADVLMEGDEPVQQEITQLPFEDIPQPTVRNLRVEEVEGAPAPEPPDPKVGWKQRFAKELGVPPQSMRGAAWDRFMAAVEEQGVGPNDAAAPQFLAAVAPTIPAGDTETSKFAIALAEAYTAPTDDQIQTDQEAAAVEATQVQADADVVPQAEASAREQVEAVEAPPVEMVDSDPVPGQPVPTVTPVGGGAEATATLPTEVETASNHIRRVAKNFQSEEGMEPQAAVEAAFSDSFYDVTTASDLDEQFTYQKLTPEWQSLPDEAKTRLTQEFSDLFDQMESVGRFQRATGRERTGDGVSLQDFNQLVAEAEANTPPEVAVVGYETAADYRRATGRPAPNDVQGVYQDGNIALIRENIRSKEELAEVIMHERGHGGLRGLLGERLNAVVNRLHANAAIRKRIEAKRQALGVDRYTAGEEVLADMVATGEQLTGDVRSKIKNAIAQGAARILGVGDLRVSDARVDQLLESTVAYIRGRPLNTNPDLAESLRNVELDEIVGDPGAFTESAVYSRALNPLERALESVDASGRPQMTADSILSGATDAARKAAAVTGSKVKDKVFRAALHATPLYWLNRMYGRLWENESGYNAFDDYADTVSAREAEGNQLVNRENDLEYEHADGTRTKYKTSVRDITARWEKLSRDNPAQHKALNAVQQFSTLWHLWPDRSWDQQQDVDYNTVGFTEAERRQALPKLQRLWKQAGKEGQDLFRTVQADFKRQWGARFNALANELSRTTGIPRYLEDGRNNPEFMERYGATIDSALNRMRSGPYSPLSRYGDFITVVTDEAGNTVHYSAYDTQADAERAAAAIRNERASGGEPVFVTVSTAQQFIPNLDGINHTTLRRFENGLLERLPEGVDESLKNDLLKGVREAYLQALPSHSIMNHANQRKGTDGFTMDALRAYTDYTMKNSRSIVDYNHNGNISRSLQAMDQQVRQAGAQGGNTVKMGQVLQAVRKQRDMYLATELNPVADFVGQAGFIQYMTSPSQLLVNAMQTIMVAVPRMAGTYGAGRSIGAFRRAMTQFAQSGGDLLSERTPVNEDFRRALEALRDDGTLDFTQVHDMLDLAQGDLAAMSGHWHTAKKVMSSFIHRSEVFNRQVTALAGMELALPGVRRKYGLSENQTLPDEAVAELARIAKQHTYDSHFVFSSSDKPGLLQGAYRRLLFQFQHYRFNMLAMLARDIRDSFSGTPAEKQTARRTLAYLIGTQAALTGAAGTIMAPIAFAIADMFRDDDDLLDSRTEFIRSTPQWLAHGLLSGVIDTSRLESGSLIPLIGDRAYAPTNASPQETIQYYLMRNLGPWVGMATDYAKMGSSFVEGKLVEGLEQGLPKAFRDPIAAVTGMNGVEDAREVVYFEPGPWSTVSQLVGLRSGERRKAEDLRGATYRLAQRVSGARGRYLGKVALGYATDDNDLMQEGYDDIRRWNEKYPDLAIGADDIRRSISGRLRSQILTDLYGVPTSSTLSESELEALNL